MAEAVDCRREALRRKLDEELELQLLDRSGVYNGWLGSGMSEIAEGAFRVASTSKHFSKLARE